MKNKKGRTNQHKEDPAVKSCRVSLDEGDRAASGSGALKRDPSASENGEESKPKRVRLGETIEQLNEIKEAGQLKASNSGAEKKTRRTKHRS